MRFPKIDYSVHPAYMQYHSQRNYDDEYIRQSIERFDHIHAQFCGLTSPSDKDAEDALSQVQKGMKKILYHCKEHNISILVEEWLNMAIQWVMAELGHEYARKIFSARDYRNQVLSGAKQKQLSLLQEQGMYITDLPADAYADIRKLAMEYRTELRERALLERFNRAVISVPFNSSLWNAIKRVTKEAGIFDVLSEFKQNKMTLLGAGLEYSCSEQTWYQNLYADIGLPDSPMQYLHIDEGECLPKSMIYVTPVGEENGPTRAIPQSNRWERSECLLLMHKALDHVVGTRYARFSRMGHYRPLAQHAELRRVFMALPMSFQGSSHFGDDVVAGSELADALINLEIPYLSQGEQALIFDGPHLLHRGSLVKSGERMALQVVYRNKNAERIKAHLSKETLLNDQIALAKKYVRKFVKSYV